MASAGGERLGNTHVALHPVWDAVDDGSLAALSLDVFDTVLWRRVPRPTDLFELVAAELRAAGRCPAWLSPVAFRRMRVAAEQEARRVRADWGSEVSLCDIWRSMPLQLFSGANLDELVEAEVDLEREFTVVDLDVAALIELAAARGIPLVLVSDTYFTESQLRRLLDRPQLVGLQGARVFRSHEHGVDKASGLWKVVLANLGLRPEQLVHVGDNSVADVEVPTELGIRTVAYTRIDHRYAAVLDREGEPGEGFDPAKLPLDADEGDFGLTSLRAKTLQVPGPGEADTALGTAWRYGAGVLGPVLTGLAEWAAAQAEQAGIATVWCPMREGELLSELVNTSATARGLAVRARPVWLSRHVTSIANLNALDKASVHQFIRRSYRLTVRQLLEMLQLRPGEVPALATRLDVVLDNNTIVDQVASALTETAHLRNRLATTVTGARERLIASLRECGALDEPELLLLDLGWGGTIQRQLAEVLQVADVPVRVSGLYLATDHRVTLLHRVGLRAQGFLGQAGHPAEVTEAVRRSPEVLEQSVSAVCGSLLGFDDDGAPSLGPCLDSASQAQQRRTVQDGVRAFHSQWYRYVSAADGAWPALGDRARDRLAGILTAALIAPTAEEAGVFGTWLHDDNFGSEISTRIVPQDLTAALPYLSPGDLDELNMRDAFWPRLLAATDPQLRAATWALGTGLLDRSVFEPAGQPSYTRLCWRGEDDRWHDGPRSQVRINHNGLSFARLDLEVGGALDVTIAVAGRPALVRIDWIEATVFSGGNPTPHVLRWETVDELASLPLTECLWLGGKIIECESERSAVLLPLAARLGAPVTCAQINVAFALLPRSTSGLEPRVPPADRLTRLAARARAEYRTRGVVGVAAGARRIAARKLAGLQ